jgi:hypothetical protein
LAALAHVNQYGIDALLVDGAQSLTGDTQAHKAFFTFHPKTVYVQIGIENPLGLVVGVGNIVAYDTTLACHLAFSGHDDPLDLTQKAELYK